MYTSKQWAKADPNVAGLIAAASGSAAAFSGRPGVGKSQAILSWCRALEYEPILLIGSTHPPEDFSGLPFVLNQGQCFEHVPAKFLYRLSQPRACCFLDELTTVPPQSRAGMLSMLSERMVGSLKIHPTTLFIAAYNPPEDAPNAVPLELSVANRFYHAKWQHDKMAWERGMTNEADLFEPSWCPPVMPTASECSRFRPMIGQHIVDFTRRNSELASTVPTAEDDYAYATPRSWKNLRDALCVAEKLDAPIPIRRQLMEGFVGREPAKAFAKYVSDLDLIDVEDAIASPMQYRHDKKRPDLTVSLLCSVVSALEHNYTQDRLTNAIELFCDNIAGSAADAVMTQLRHLVATKGNDRLSAEAAESIKKFGARIPDAVKRRKSA
jgi:hypothetical protein